MSKMLKNIVFLLMLANLAISQIRSDPEWYCLRAKMGQQELWAKCRWDGKPEVRDVAMWEMPSETQRCPQNEQCQLQFQVDTISRVTGIKGPPIDVTGMIPIVGELGVGIEDSRTLSTGVTKSESVTCDTPPDYQSNVWSLVLKKQFTGKVIIEFKEWVNGTSGPVRTFTSSYDFEVMIPVVDLDSRRMIGYSFCRQTPLSNFNEIYFYKNDNQMKEGCELDAVNNALDNSLRSIPPKDMNVLSTGSSCGIKVYVRTMCFNLDDPNSYNSKCSSCIKYARTHILPRGDNANGMNWRLQDCYLRFEFYHFD